MRPVRFLAPARQEARDAAAFYKSRARGLGSDFLDKVDSAVKDICENPECWPIIDQDVRRRLIRRFPYCLLYRVDPNEVVVLAVMHLRRHPNCWNGRG